VTSDFSARETQRHCMNGTPRICKTAFNTEVLATPVLNDRREGFFEKYRFFNPRENGGRCVLLLSHWCISRALPSRPRLQVSLWLLRLSSLNPPTPVVVNKSSAPASQHWNLRFWVPFGVVLAAAIVAVVVVVSVLSPKSSSSSSSSKAAAATPTPTPDVIDFTLTVGYYVATLPDINLPVALLSYNDNFIGPTLEATPGQTVRFKLINTLPPNREFIGDISTANWLECGWVPPPGWTPHYPWPDDHMSGHHTLLPSELATSPANYQNNPHNFRSTNWHTHGLQVRLASSAGCWLLCSARACGPCAGSRSTTTPLFPSTQARLGKSICPSPRGIRVEPSGTTRTFTGATLCR